MAQLTHLWHLSSQKYRLASQRNSGKPEMKQQVSNPPNLPKSYLIALNNIKLTNATSLYAYAYPLYRDAGVLKWLNLKYEVMSY